MNNVTMKSAEFEELRRELRAYHGRNGGRECVNARRLELTARRKEALKQFYETHPEADSCDLRGEVYRMLGEDFEPILFPDSPFYFETGGNGGWNGSGIGLYVRKLRTWPVLRPFEEHYNLFHDRNVARFFNCCGPFFDVSHNGAPISNILRRGFKGFREDARALAATNLAPAERKFIETALKGFDAVRNIMTKYVAAAEAELRRTDLTARQRKFMRMVAESAARSPWEPPRTFYEGLNTCWFVREVMGEFEGLMVNTLGRPDAWLIDLYRADLAAGRITEEDAYDLVTRFLLHEDGIYEHDDPVEEYNADRTRYENAHENECGITLGGCDAEGREVFNELTRLFLRAHREHAMIYPKLFLRFTAHSDPEYLRLLADDLATGRGIYALLNDDSLIPALIADGKRAADARNYCCTGCWDIVVDSCEDNAGGNYFNLARILEATIYQPRALLKQLQYRFAALDDAGTFEEVYTRIMGNAKQVLREMLAAQGRFGKYWADIAPAPLNSACSSDCLANRRDFTAGGQRYNPHAVSLCFWANFVDSLLSIRQLCFVERRCTLPELLAAVRGNWAGAEHLRQFALEAPHWGDNRPETIELARRIFDEFYEESRLFRNERGGGYQLGFWTYREFRYWGELTPALPDGRHDGDLLAQSFNPSHFRNHEALTTVLQCLASLDLRRCAGDSVINMVLDRDSCSAETVAALLRAFSKLGLQLLQLNCLGRRELLDAQKHPDAHADLVVRVCGFSAKFTALSPAWQQEVIRRTGY